MVDLGSTLRNVTVSDPVPVPSSPPLVLGAPDLPPEQADAVLDATFVAEPDIALLEVSGAGALQCLQGLLTNDLDVPGDGAFVYGAVLTPKGTIICDLWVARDAGKLTLSVPRRGVPDLMEMFRRSLPPRLARTIDRSGEAGALRLAGPGSADVMQRAGIAAPPVGRVANAIVGDAACVVARPPGDGPFTFEIRAPIDDLAAVENQLTAAGALTGGPAGLELARILSGWPALGAEIDRKTLPQEVRYDEINGVSYTKGCYTGQETVARVHFRGHPNRHLVGLVWEEPPALEQSDVTQGGKVRGRVTSVAWLAPVERFVGLGVVRREVDRDQPVTAAAAPAAVIDLPFALE
jgi:tRNA-modifying protein YgfZ